MQSIENAVIAAAGIGARLGLGHPKCMIEVGGKTLLAHLLERLNSVQNISICVGFMSELVINEARKIRNDIVFVQNHAFQTTTTLNSYFLGSQTIKGPALYMDADIYFTPDSFENFSHIATTQSTPLIAVTKVKTQDCVYSHLNENNEIVSFSRVNPSPYEWANLAYLPCELIENINKAVFEHLSSHLPIDACEIESFEVDTIQDLNTLNNYMNLDR